MSDELKALMARIDERTIAIQKTQDEHVSKTNKILDDHEQRIRKNTTFRNWLAGGLTLGGTGLGAALSKLFGQ